MTRADHTPCELLEWDTDFFGFRVARVRGETLTPERARPIDAWCRQAGVRCLYFLSRADDPDTTRLAEDHHFRLVDMRVTFARSVANGSQLPGDRPDNHALVRPAQPNDLRVLQDIARHSYRDTRFYFDSNFPPHLSDSLYQTWIRRSCEGYADSVLVAELGGEPAGYISCHLDKPSPAGRIGLVGVSQQAQGQGLGQKLVLSAVEWFQAQQVQAVSVATQARNSAAQRLYQRCGFLVQSVQLWYHKWYRPEEPAHV